jgi:hypothetical protein
MSSGWCGYDGGDRASIAAAGRCPEVQETAAMKRDPSFGEAVEKLCRRLKVTTEGKTDLRFVLDLFWALLREQPEFEGILSPRRGKRVKLNPEDAKLLVAINVAYVNFLRERGLKLTTPMPRRVLLEGVKKAQDRHSAWALKTSPEGLVKRLLRLDKASEELLVRALRRDGHLKK